MNPNVPFSNRNVPITGTNSRDGTRARDTDNVPVVPGTFVPSRYPGECPVCVAQRNKAQHQERFVGPDCFVRSSGFGSHFQSPLRAHVRLFCVAEPR